MHVTLCLTTNPAFVIRPLLANSVTTSKLLPTYPVAIDYVCILTVTVEAELLACELLDY